MKNQNRIPQKLKFPKQNQVKQNTPTKTIKVSELSKEELTEINSKTNLIFILSDIQESFALEIEETFKKHGLDRTLDNYTKAKLRKIKENARELVRFVDNQTNDKFSEKFGEMSDVIKSHLCKMFNIEE